MNDESKKREMKVKEARFLVKWSPAFWFLVLAVAAFYLDRFLAGPSVASFLRLLSPVGASFWLAGCQREARATLRGEKESLSSASIIPGFLMMCMGRPMGELYDAGHRIFPALFVIIVSLLLAFYGFMFWEERQQRARKRLQLPVQRAAANGTAAVAPASPIEPAP